MNERKHGVSFHVAARILVDNDGDRYHLVAADSGKAELRFVAIASDPANRSTLSVIVWTDRSTAGGPINRVVSARFANRKERKR